MDFTAIDDRYGMLADFSELVQKANKLDLKVVVSLDLRTISSDSEWFRSSASRAAGYEHHIVWVNEKPDDVQDDTWWVWHEQRQGYWAARDNSSLLNLCSARVAAALASAQCAWLRRGVNGLLYRPDFTRDVDCGVRLVSTLAADATRCARSANLDVPVIIAESALGASTAARYYGEGEAGANSVVSVVGGPRAPGRGPPPAPDLALSLHAALLLAPPDAAVAWLTSAGGEARLATRLGADLVDCFNLLALVLPGAALLQQGDELGAADAILDWAETRKCWPRPAYSAAAPFPWDDTSKAGFTDGEPWLPLAPNYRYANAKTEIANELSHVSVARTAAAVRRSPAIGPHVEIKRLGPTLAVLRWGGGGSLLYVGNLGRSTAESEVGRVPGLPAQMTVAAGSGSSSYPPGTHVPTDKGVRLGPGEAVLLVGPPRHCSGPGPVDKIATKLTEGWQKINKYFSNL
ncbi:maltase 1-like isoform X2 [Aricia agestis]|nr:maltase 1-like isoform X2 [Aricia agestis]